MLMPGGVIYRTISEVKEVRNLGSMRRNEGVLFGAFISLGISNSIQTGSEQIFVTEAERWGIGFWGGFQSLLS
jgi:hypothetical protein